MRSDPTIFPCLSVFLAVLLLALAAPAHAQPQFLSAPIYPVVGINPGQAVVGDFNSDGRSDIAVTMRGTGSHREQEIDVFIANADGTLQPAVSYPTTRIAIGITAADFNHDGRLDLAVATVAGIDIFLSNGDGTFQPEVNYFPHLSLSSVVTGDFDGDGKIDIVASDGLNAYFVKGNGDGTFQPHTTLFSGSFLFNFTVADFNHDGKLDLAATRTSGAGDLAIFLGNGDGTVQPEVDYPLGGFPDGMAVADFNHDGKPDVAFSKCGNIPCTVAGDLGIMLGNGDGTFQSPKFFAGVTENVVSSLIAIDLNNDGNVDLAATSGAGANVTVFLGKGDGTIGRGVSWAAGLRTGRVVAGDFNHDGIVDLATVNGGGNNLSVLLGAGHGNFVSARTFGVGTQPRFVATGDFNEDGIPDVAVAENPAAAVDVLLGKVGGALGTPVHYATAGGQARQIVVADLNGDHHLDLVVLGISSSTPISVMLGNGDGTFQPAVNLSDANVPSSVVVGDFNGDGIPDIATGESASTGGIGSIGLFLGNGDGTFHAPTAVSVGSSGLNFITAGDFNGDGKLDIAVVNGNQTVDVLLGNGNGTFHAPSTPIAVPGIPQYAVAADLNGDGKLDLVVNNELSSTSSVSVLIGKGDGTFNSPVSYNAGSDAESLVVADFNGDGLPDIAVANTGQGSTAGSVIVLRGTGGGAFAAASPSVVGAAPISIAVADFDGDGHPDVVTANVGSTNVSVLLNAQP